MDLDTIYQHLNDKYYVPLKETMNYIEMCICLPEKTICQIFIQSSLNTITKAGIIQETSAKGTFQLSVR